MLRQRVDGRGLPATNIGRLLNGSRHQVGSDGVPPVFQFLRVRTSQPITCKKSRSGNEPPQAADHVADRARVVRGAKIGNANDLGVACRDWEVLGARRGTEWLD